MRLAFPDRRAGPRTCGCWPGITQNFAGSVEEATMPEPVTTAILAAIAAGAAMGATETVKQAIGDAYAGLKALITDKLGSTSKAVEAVAKLEEDPTSAGWKETAGKE